MSSVNKVESRAVDKIRNLIDELDYVTERFNTNDKGQSWDGYIDLYNGNPDVKANLAGIIYVQIKGRTVHTKRLEDKCKFDLDKVDLENFNKVDGTVFFLVKMKDNGDFKVYYSALLPKNIHDLLKEQPNTKNEIKIQLREVKDSFHLEKICRNFFEDQRKQKKLDFELFNTSNLLINNCKSARFLDWNRGKYNPLEILGEEKFVYLYDKEEKIIGVEFVTINELIKNENENIIGKDGRIFYSKIKRIIDVDGNTRVIFGNGMFQLSTTPKELKYFVKGSLYERLIGIEFIENMIANNGFFIGESWITLLEDNVIIEEIRKQKSLYIKMSEFCYKHKINKDLKLDEWSFQDFKNFIIWIDAIDNNKKIKLNEMEMSLIGSIKIKDIRFSILAEMQNDGGFIVSSIWNIKEKKKYYFIYDEGIEKIKTNNIFSVLNKQAYLSDDLNIQEMKDIFRKSELNKNEEILINLQVLEIISAYDINNKIELLEYAKYLLEKIKDIERMKEIVRINYLQIEKRIRVLTEEEIEEILLIRNAAKDEEKFMKISANLLIDNITEAKMIFKSLKAEEQNIFLKFPIAKFFNN